MDVTERVVDQIIQKCKEKGFAANHALTSFMAKSIIMDSSLGFSQQTQFEPKDLLQLIDLTTRNLCQTDSPQLETVKLQVAMLSHRSDYRKQLQLEKESDQFKSEKLIEEIIKKTEEAEVFGDIVLYILHETKLLAVSNEVIEKETMTALESVIPRDFINSFITQNEEEKNNQLYDLWKIVWGIRLFNKASNKGGAGIDTLEKHNITQMQELKEKIGDALQQLLPSMSLYQDVLANFSGDREREVRLRHEHINRQQVKSFFLRLDNTLTRLIQDGTKIVDNQKQLIYEIRQIVNNSVAVPKNKIYPLFIDLAELWQQSIVCNDSTIEVDMLLNVLYQNMEPTFRETIHEVTEFERKGSSSTPYDDMAVADDDIPEASFEEEEAPKRVPPTRNVIASLGGFDPVAMTTGRLMAVPGDNNVQMVEYDAAYYAFQTDESAEKFMNNPQYYLDKVVLQTRAQPDLYHLLDLQDHLPEQILLHQQAKKKIKVSTSIQTETHPVKSFIDPKYEWSEWKLRQQALKIADLRRKRTHSTQTVQSHFRRDNLTQVSSKPNQPVGTRTHNTQTRRETGTNPIKHVRYVKGLRSKGEKKVKVVHMTFEQTS